MKIMFDNTLTDDIIDGREICINTYTYTYTHNDIHISAYTEGETWKH